VPETLLGEVAAGVGLDVRAHCGQHGTSAAGAEQRQDVLNTREQLQEHRRLTLQGRSLLLLLRRTRRLRRLLRRVAFRQVRIRLHKLAALWR